MIYSFPDSDSSNNVNSGFPVDENLQNKQMFLSESTPNCKNSFSNC